MPAKKSDRKRGGNAFKPVEGRDPRDTTGGFARRPPAVVKFTPLEGKRGTGGFVKRRPR